MANFYSFHENAMGGSGNNVDFDNETVSISKLIEYINDDFESTMNPETGQFEFKGRIGFVDSDEMFLFTRASMKKDENTNPEEEDEAALQLFAFSEETVSQGRFSKEAIVQFKPEAPQGFDAIFHYVFTVNGYSFPMYFFHYDNPMIEPVALIPMVNPAEIKNIIGEFYSKSYDCYTQLTGKKA